MDNRELPTISVQKMDPMLCRAAMEGNIEVLTSIVEANEPPPDLTLCLTPQKNTVLHIAVEFGHQTIVEKVIQLFPSLISQRNSRGDTPLHVAARAGHLDLTKRLTPALEEGNPMRQAGGVALRMSNLEGSNPIHEALKKSHDKVALHLLAFEERHGLEREVNMAGESLLYLAAEAGLDEVVQKIIDTGDYSTQGPDGQNPLHIAVIKGRLGVVAILLRVARKLIPEVDGFGNTVLHYASAQSYCRKDSNEAHLQKQNQKQILQLLLEANPYLAYVPNRNGDYPLFSAIRNGFLLAVEAIIDHCPDSAELVDQNGRNALHLAVIMENQGKGTLISGLKCEKPINESDNDDAVQASDYYVALLHEDVSRKGQNALPLAVTEEDRSMLWHLLLNRLEFKKLINEPDNDGNTPMHLAILTKRHDIVKRLIDSGLPDLTMSDKEGLTAMDLYGYTKKEDSILDKLRESGAVPGRHQWQERFRYPPPIPTPTPTPTQTQTLPKLSTRPNPNQPDQIQTDQTRTDQTRSQPISSKFINYGLQTLPIITSLVATVTFAAAFTVPGGYKNDGPREGLPVFMRNTALQAFVLSDTLAFCISMAATVLLAYANAHSESAFKIYWVLQTCYYISGVAILATITAFVTAVYVLTSKESLWLAVTSMLLGFVVPLILVFYRWGLEEREKRCYRRDRVRYTFGS